MIPLSTPLRFLPLLSSELQLATVLKSGQSFRWTRFDTVHATRPDVKLEQQDDASSAISSEHVNGVEWAFGWGDRTVVLRQDDKGIHYRALYPPLSPHTAYLADLETDTTRKLLVSYFQLDTPLAPLYAQWASQDPHFRKKIDLEGERLEGIRVLNQDPWETLVSFICSANNNISRIGLMVNRVCESLGAHLPHPSSFSPSTVHTPATFSSYQETVPSRRPAVPTPIMYAFPPPSALTPDTTDLLLRQLGFGYRAPFIEWTANYLVDTAAAQNMTPHEYLESLRQGKYTGGDGLQGARAKLMEFKGVGRKVADCIALFALGWTETVPVDTHVFQIAIRDYGFPSNKATALTPVLHDRVCARLQALWGPHAGWAQQVLFFADLKPTSSSAASAAQSVGSVDPSNRPVPANVVKHELTTVVRDKFKEELEAIMSTPGAKRRRTTVKAEVKDESDDDDNNDDEEERAKVQSRFYPSPAPTAGSGSDKKPKKTRSLAGKKSPSRSSVKKIGIKQETV